MTRKTVAVDKMSSYFESKGAVLDRNQYIKANDGPLKMQSIKRSCGSWSRMIAICNNTYPERMTNARTKTTVTPPQNLNVVYPATPDKVAPPVRTASDALRELSKGK